MKKVLVWLSVGAALAFVAAAWIGVGRVTWAVGPQVLNSAAALVNAAQGDAAVVVKQGCRYDTTPETLADGDVAAQRCNASGDTFIELAGQATPSAQTTIACDDTGAVSFTANAAANRIEMWNTGANDVCVRWGTAGTPDRTTLTSCSFVLGAHAGSGTSEVYATPADFRVGSEAFECDAAAATNLVVVEWRAQ